MITELSSRKLEKFWKFGYLYSGMAVIVISFIVIAVIKFNLTNPNINKDFIIFFEDNIYNAYALLGLWLLINLFLSSIFARLVHIQVDEQSGDVYIDKNIVDKKRIKFIAEVVLFSMLFVVIKKDNIIRTWVPKLSPYRDTVWPLPFFVRLFPRNKYAKILNSLLTEN